MADGWGLPLGPQQAGQIAAVLHEMGSIRTGGLVALALLAMAWGHGLAAAAFILRLCRCVGVQTLNPKSFCRLER